MKFLGDYFWLVLNLPFVPKGDYKLSYGGLLLIALACIVVFEVVKFFFASWGDKV